MPSTFRTFACAAYIGRRERPWPFSPSHSAATRDRATLLALSTLVRLRVSVRTTSPSAWRRVSVGMARISSGAPVKLGHHILAMAERFGRGQPAVGGAHDHV